MCLLPLRLSCVFLANYVPKCQMSLGPYGPISFFQASQFAKCLCEKEQQRIQPPPPITLLKLVKKKWPPRHATSFASDRALPWTNFWIRCRRNRYTQILSVFFDI